MSIEIKPSRQVPRLTCSFSRKISTKQYESADIFVSLGWDLPENANNSMITELKDYLFSVIKIAIHDEEKNIIQAFGRKETLFDLMQKVKNGNANRMGLPR